MKKEANKGMQMIKVMKKDWTKYIHILIIIMGAMFIAFSCFHTNLWFDESYSVAIVNHTFSEIWTIGSHDVHPVLYYEMLKIVGILTNNSILAYRLFSCLPLIILSILGITHIRKDFGKKTGIIFSFLVLFMPVTLMYSGEIRMYTWSMLFVSITSIYAYRIYKSGISNKNWIIFSIFSLLSAYTHYYALIAVAIINIALFMYFLINNIKQRNYEVKYKKYSKNLRNSIISAIIQIILYIPWISIFLAQYGQVSKGFWIGTPDFLEIFNFQFTGILEKNTYLPQMLSYIFSAIMTIYMIILFIKNFKEIKVAKLALVIYALVIVVVGVISIATPILYARYFLNITGIFLFVFAFLMSKDDNKVTLGIICTLIVITSSIVNINLIKNNYDKTNNLPIEFVQSEIKKEDIILTDNKNGFGSGLVMSSYFQNNELYFWDRENWNTEEAYKAFGNTIYNLGELENYRGRIWIISENTDNLLVDVKDYFNNNINIIKSQKYEIKYHGYKFAISLIERN